MTPRSVRNDAAFAPTIDLRVRRSLRHQGDVADGADIHGDVAAPGRPTLTVAEAADLLGVSPWLVRQQIALGLLPHVRLGRRVLISRSRLLAWLDTDLGPATR